MLIRSALLTVFKHLGQTEMLKLSFSLERVCPKSHALREELNQLQSDMVTCQQKIDHYSAQVMKINGEVFKLHE